MPPPDPANASPGAAVLRPEDARRRVFVLLLIVFVDLLGFGVLIPLIPFYAVRLGLPAEAVTLVIALHSLMQFVGAPILGRLSDRHGRRPVLAISMAGHALAYALLIVSDSLLLLIVSRLLSGITSANLAAAYAYITDVTPPDRRAASLAKLSAAFALGFALGPAIGGVLAGGVSPEQADLVRPAIAAALFSMLALLGIVLFLPESHAPQRAAAGTAARVRPPGRRQLLRDRALAFMVTLALLVLAFAAMRESLLSLWLHDRLAFDAHTIGLVFTVNGLMIAVVQFTITGRLATRFGEMATLRIGVACYGLSWLGLVLAPGLALVLVAIAINAVGTALFGTSLQTLVSLRAPAAVRGAVMGLYQSSSSLARFIGAAFSGTLFGQLGPNVPFAIGAVAMLPAMAMTFAIATRLKLPAEGH
ncbi:MAG: MFS transporter [Gammaproteobacteria bacterium]|nr:MFS transporter [Gammaproteobacteria bacterium]